MLEKIPLNSIVFVDSNIFIYHFLDVSEYCTDFLERIELKEIEAYTSTVVLAEVLHRLMIAEVVEKYNMLTNDSLNLCVMKANGLNEIATNDGDFERVDWVKVWKP